MSLIDLIKQAAEEEKVDFSIHAEYEMLNDEYGIIKTDEVLEVIQNGNIVEEYPETFPLPSCLINGKTNKGKPLHIVVAYDEEDESLQIITVYRPNPNLWKQDFKVRKK